jgi:hypothetical protein
VAACSEAKPRDADSAAAFASDTVHLDEVAAAYRPNILDSVALSFPKALDIAGDTVAIVDQGELLTLFNLDMNFVTRWSQRGEGPGELQAPLDIERDGSEWVVADGGNGRLQRFDDAGNATSSLRTSANLSQIATIPDGVVVMSRGATYLALLDSTGTPNPWGPSMSPRDTSRVERATSAFDKHFLADFRDGVVILDGETADIFVVRLDGTVAKKWSLSGAVRSEMFAETGVRDHDDAFPGAVAAYRPGFNAIAVSSDGAWMVAIPGGTNPFGPGPLFINLSTGVWYPSRVAISEVEWRPPRYVIEVALDSDQLFLVNFPSDGSILRVPVRLPPSE